jgi:hypothetical protein
LENLEISEICFEIYQPAEPEYEAWWRMSEAYESPSSYSVEQDDIFQYQSYSHSGDMFIILKSNINRMGESYCRL